MTDLFPHQQAAVDKAERALAEYGGMYCAHGVGSGKSRTAIEIAKRIGARRILVVVGPVAALGVWRSELEKWWPEAIVRPRLNVDDVREFFRTPPPVPAVHVTNMDKLGGVSHESTRANLEGWRPDLLISDENHYVKSPSAQRTRAVWKLRTASRYFLALSGTPAHNPLDYWAQYRMIDPANPLWSQRFTAYREQIAHLGGPNRNWVMKQLGEHGFKQGTNAMIATTVAPYTHWFDTKDLHLPEPIYTEVPFDLYPQEQRIYRDMGTRFRAEVESGVYTSASTALVKAMRLHQLSSGHATDDDGVDRWIAQSAKLDTLLSLLADRTHQKIVIVCRFRSEIENIMDSVLAGDAGDWAGGQIGVIHGNTPTEIRGQVLSAFSRDRGTHEHTGGALLLIQPRAGGIAADMTAADAMIFYSLEPSSIVYRQTVGRVWRQGQTKYVQILTLLGRGTIDEPLYRGLQRGLDGNDLAQYVIAGVK